MRNKNISNVHTPEEGTLAGSFTVSTALFLRIFESVNCQLGNISKDPSQTINNIAHTGQNSISETTKNRTIYNYIYAKSTIYFLHSVNYKSKVIYNQSL